MQNLHFISVQLERLDTYLQYMKKVLAWFLVVLDLVPNSVRSCEQDRLFTRTCVRRESKAPVSISSYRACFDAFHGQPTQHKREAHAFVEWQVRPRDGLQRSDNVKLTEISHHHGCPCDERTWETRMTSCVFGRAVIPDGVLVHECYHVSSRAYARLSFERPIRVHFLQRRLLQRRGFRQTHLSLGTESRTLSISRYSDRWRRAGMLSTWLHFVSSSACDSSVVSILVASCRAQMTVGDDK